MRKFRDDPPEALSEHLPEKQIRVSDSLIHPHRLISSFKKSLKDHSYVNNGLVSGIRGEIKIRVAKENMGRALRIMDALFKAMEDRGMEVFIDQTEYLTYVRCLGQIVPISLYEKVRMHRLEKKPNTYQTMEYIPTGELVLKFWNDIKCCDIKDRKLEDCLNDFVIKIYRDAHKQNIREIEWERSRKEEEERRLRAEEIIKKQEIERQRFQALEKDAINWQKSHLINTYIEAAKKAHGEIQPGSEFDQWVSWATQYAGILDPLKGKKQ